MLQTAMPRRLLLFSPDEAPSVDLPPASEPAPQSPAPEPPPTAQIVLEGEHTEPAGLPVTPMAEPTAQKPVTNLAEPHSEPSQPQPIPVQPDPEPAPEPVHVVKSRMFSFGRS